MHTNRIKCTSCGTYFDADDYLNDELEAEASEIGICPSCYFMGGTEVDDYTGDLAEDDCDDNDGSCNESTMDDATTMVTCVYCDQQFELEEKYLGLGIISPKSYICEQCLSNALADKDVDELDDDDDEEDDTEDLLMGH